MRSLTVGTFLILLFSGSLAFAQFSSPCSGAGWLPGDSRNPPIYVRMSTTPDTYWLNQESDYYVAWGPVLGDAVPRHASRSLLAAPAPMLSLEAPLAATQAGPQIYVVARMTSDILMYRRFDPRTGPTESWQLIPGSERTVGGAAVAAEELLPDGSVSPVIDFFANTADGRVMMDRFLPTPWEFPDGAHGVWSGWTEVPGKEIMRSTPVAVQFRGNLHLIARGSNDGIWENVRAGGSWSGWYEIPGFARTLHPPMAAVTRGTAQLEVAIVAYDPLYPGYIQRTARRTGLVDLFGTTSWTGRWMRYETSFHAEGRLGLRGLSDGQVEIGVYPGYDLLTSMAYRCPAL